MTVNAAFLGITTKSVVFAVSESSDVIKRNDNFYLRLFLPNEKTVEIAMPEECQGLIQQAVVKTIRKYLTQLTEMSAEVEK